jgi:hypothetical protein
MPKSYPWPGVVGGAGAGDDAGRYTSPEWWSVWGTQQRAGVMIIPTAGGGPLRTIADWTNIGVYYGVDNKLEVADLGGFVAEVESGAALVDGQYFVNESSKTLVLPASQTYYVVVRKNFTATDYTPPGYTAGDGVVPAYTSRVTWVSAQVQSTDRTTYWDIPLATVVTGGASITSVTDTREWVDAETKYKFVPALMGQNDVAYIYPEVTGGTMAITMTDGDDTHAYGRIEAPVDYITDMTVQGVSVSVGAAGNIYASLTWHAGACAESYTTHNGTSGIAAEAVTPQINRHSCNRSVAITAITPGDILYFDFYRNSTDPLDDLGNDFYFIGFLIEYLGWR